MKQRETQRAQGQHKNPFIYISTYCNNIYQELLTFVFDFRKTSDQKPLTLNNTSGLFNHHMRRVIQRGEALWKEKNKKEHQVCLSILWFWLHLEKKNNQELKMNKQTRKLTKYIRK